MAAWSDGYWVSSDGLKLHYRDYAGGASRPPILCIPGLTRNARDFEGVAERLAGKWRLICVDLRGRGESAHAKDPMTYLPLIYLQDLEALIAELDARALRPVRHLARRADDDAARRRRTASGSPAPCSTISGRRSRRAGSTISAPMSAARRTGRPGSTPPASSPRRRPTAIPAGTSTNGCSTPSGSAG